MHRRATDGTPVSLSGAPKTLRDAGGPLVDELDRREDVGESDGWAAARRA